MPNEITPACMQYAARKQLQACLQEHGWSHIKQQRAKGIAASNAATPRLL
jgi:hypothetical protein